MKEFLIGIGATSLLFIAINLYINLINKDASIVCICESVELDEESFT